MNIRLDPHYRVTILPNVGWTAGDTSLTVFAEVENSHPETVTSATIVAVAYRDDGSICGVEEGGSYMTLREGERKAVKMVLEVDPAVVESVRLYAETEFDDDDPVVAPPQFMQNYFEERP